MRAELYWIPGGEGHQLAIMPRPRGGDWLRDELISWQSSGLTTVVSLLEPHEEEQLELTAERAIGIELGLEFIAFPIGDRGVPEMGNAFSELVHRLAAKVEAGQPVGIHCRMGIGRSAVLAACILVRMGKIPLDAFAAIAAARGIEVPDTPEQIAWVNAFACGL